MTDYDRRSLDHRYKGEMTGHGWRSLFQHYKREMTDHGWRSCFHHGKGGLVGGLAGLVAFTTAREVGLMVGDLSCTTTRGR